MKKYKVSSTTNSFDPYILEVNDNGIVVDDGQNGILIGSKFESLKTFWDGYEGEYNITEHGK